MLLKADIPEITPDSLFALQARFKECPHPDKINLGIGTYKTQAIEDYRFSCLDQAEQRVLKEGYDKNYQPILGEQALIKKMLGFLFPKYQELVEQGKLWGAQALGGTGALKIAADTLKHCQRKKIALSSPTWINHQVIFEYAGLETQKYAYFCKKTFSFDYSSFIHDLEKGFANILLQVCCHNPTGQDLSNEQWEQTLNCLKKNETFIVFDLAYQGFSGEFNANLFPLEYCLQHQIPFFLCYSFSKNLGLYGERAGMFISYTPDHMVAKKLQALSQKLIRANYSNPPKFVAKVLLQLFSDPKLLSSWTQELKPLQRRIEEVRTCLDQQLGALFPSLCSNYFSASNGLFQLLPLDQQQVSQLEREFHIFLPESARINVAGLSEQNLKPFVNALEKVAHKK